MTAFSALLEHRLRTFLAVLGLAVGVAAVVIMTGVGKGTESKIVAGIADMGTDLLIVRSGKVLMHRDHFHVVGQVKKLALEDAKAIRRQVFGISDLSAVVDGSLSAKRMHTTTETNVIGGEANIFSLLRYELALGRSFLPNDSLTRRRVAILGATVVRNLFGHESPIGQAIILKKLPFTVIGVLAPKGTDPMGNDQDDQVFIPLLTSMKRLYNQLHINHIIVRVESEKHIPAIEKSIKKLLRHRHRLDLGESKEEYFAVQKATELFQRRKEMTEMFSKVIVGVAAISLVVGGVGIMAVMLIAVGERTSEIGVRRALGARKLDIGLQFLIEAALMGLSGGLGGLLLGLAGIHIIQALGSLPMDMPWKVGLIAMGFSLLIALVFGLYPARRAARLDPVKAIMGS